MEKEIKILRQGVQGDRHVMSFEEAKQKIYDIVLNDTKESEEYLANYPTRTIFDFAGYIQYFFVKTIEDGYVFEFDGVEYLVLDDEIVEDLWKELGDVPFDEEENGELILAEGWFIFDKGTDRDTIWHWFDDHHSQGVGWLMNEYK